MIVYYFILPWKNITLLHTTNVLSIINGLIMDLQIRDKLALVTASSEGIGFAIAKSLAQEGARVIINSRTADLVRACSIGTTIIVYILVASLNKKTWYCFNIRSARISFCPFSFSNDFLQLSSLWKICFNRPISAF